ncbi:MAG: hypothetical protein ACEQSK_11190 [Sphingomonadaceae bacterium]
MRVAVPLVLVTGARPGVREAAIAAALRPGEASVVILEGLSDGSEALLLDGAGELASRPGVSAQVHRIAPGCLHCSGNLVLRVTLNRILRQSPARLYISLATATHLEQLRTWLSEAPYGDLLSLQADIAA